MLIKIFLLIGYCDVH